MLTLDQAKTELANGFFSDVNPETDRFEELLDLLKDKDKISFAKWVYEHCENCYVGTRRVAGLLLADKKLEQFMKLSSDLIRSRDPYDRDTTFSALHQIDDPRRFEYLRVLLDDSYLQFSVIDYMYHYFPDEILNKLREVEKSADKQIRNLATERISRFFGEHE